MLASSALKQAVSDESSTIRLSTPPRSEHPETSLSTFDSMASSNNSGWQSDIESLDDKQMSEANGGLDDSEDKETNVPLVSDLICPEEAYEACSSTSKVHIQLDQNPFGEPDAFPQSIDGSTGICANYEGKFDNSRILAFSDSETWDEREYCGTKISHLVMSYVTNAEPHMTLTHVDAAPGDSFGTVSTESVCWSQLIDGLADRRNEDLSQNDASRCFAVARDPGATHSFVSPFTEASDDNDPALDVGLVQPRAQPLNKRMSRVQSLRIKSQKHLEEMFAANLRIFDNSTSAAAHPGSVPWILPRNSNCSIPTQASIARKGIQ